MIRKGRKWKCLLLAVLMIFMLFPRTDASALTAKQKALKAYTAFLARSTVPVVSSGKTCYSEWHPYTYKGSRASEVYFGLAYIDNDSIPELVLKTLNPYVSNKRPRITAVFTYYNGRVKRVKEITNNYGYVEGYFYKAGAYKWIQLDEGGDRETYISPLRNGTTTRKLRRDDNTYGLYPTVYYKYVSGNTQRISRSSFVKLYKSMTKSKSLTRIKYHQNTAANRKNYLK